MYYLLDKDLNIVCPIENYKSMIWTTRYYTSGDFELYAPATSDLINLIKKDYYIIRDDDLTQAMIIQNIQITTDLEEGNFLIVTGKSLKSILNRRIVWKQTTVSGTVEACIRKLITDNIISPTLQARKIDNFILGTELGNTATMRQQLTGDNLEEAISTICINHGLGYDVLLDLDEKQFVFILFQGSDRSYSQTENPYVIFSNEFENLLSTNYASNSENYKNVALVAGEGEGVDRKTSVVGDASGMDRYELYVDSRDTSTNDEETITDSEYDAILQTKGQDALAETVVNETIEGDIEANHTWQYGRDYFLGDLVEVTNEYGYGMRSRITEVIESEDDTGTNLIVSFVAEEYIAPPSEYIITYKLSACTSNNKITVIEPGSAYAATITGVQHQGFMFREDTDFSVTMAGVDITKDVVSHGSYPCLTLDINIPNVTGDIIISANAG